MQYNHLHIDNYAMQDWYFDCPSQLNLSSLRGGQQTGLPSTCETNQTVEVFLSLSSLPLSLVSLCLSHSLPLSFSLCHSLSFSLSLSDGHSLTLSLRRFLSPPLSSCLIQKFISSHTYCRLLRLKRRYRDIMSTIVYLAPKMLTVAVFLGIVYYFFAIIGVEFLSGKVFKGCW